ncbi:choice-of-anchor L family PEP-CTERM protein [Noviherbaspirillum sedimenti]|uniref:PEP-CTERM sorting domain-containing protein n=1 Tax=Noviherbaspirillum sedimenti TaxID=2320865 RepID=A0A3A3G2J1_9BURK|nr:PEP-CTERM sorting domain-containing protein [Noviherbaspirillum sedimenti]
MKFSKLSSILAALTLSMAASSASALVVTANNNATALANALGGSGVSISNATFLSTASSTATGTFTGGADSVGFASGVLLTTGTVNCAPGPNTSANCGDTSGTTTSLKFDFTSDTGNVYFKYVFASEEYNEWVGSQFNDQFELRLNGVNVALLPGAGGVVSINNVNNGSNAAYYRDNTVLGLDLGYDGLTTVLVAQATGITGTNTFEFLIKDLGDFALDSGVFIEAGTFSGTNPVPEPTGLALFGLGLLGLLAAKRKKA